MNNTEFEKILSPEALIKIFPSDKSNDFFEALLGDADEGAFDIQLGFRNANENQLVMELQLLERPGRCLACNLTHGLPTVFSRHPIINVKGTVESINDLLGEKWNCLDWKLGGTEQKNKSLHCIPIIVDIEKTI
ncbi:MAG: pancreas/duodenum homeobox protein 1 [Desulfotalea sp.]